MTYLISSFLDLSAKMFSKRLKVVGRISALSSGCKNCYSSHNFFISSLN